MIFGRGLCFLALSAAFAAFWPQGQPTAALQTTVLYEPEQAFGGINVIDYSVNSTVTSAAADTADRTFMHKEAREYFVAAVDTPRRRNASYGNGEVEI